MYINLKTYLNESVRDKKEKKERKENKIR